MVEDEKKGKARPRPVVEEILNDEPQTSAKDKQEEPTKGFEEKVSEIVGEEGERGGGRGVSFRLLFVLTILTALVVGFVAGGVYVYWAGIRSVADGSGNVQEPAVERQTQVIPTATPLPEPEDVDLSEFKVKVLNGSGKIGEAGKVEKLLSDAGFAVKETGNAESFDFEETEISSRKNNVPRSVVSKLKETLEKTYEVKIGEELAETSDYDILVIVGATTK